MPGRSPESVSSLLAVLAMLSSAQGGPLAEVGAVVYASRHFLTSGGRNELTPDGSHEEGTTMATTAYCTLKIGGRLAGPLSANQEAKDFLEYLKSMKPGGGSVTDYAGFLRPEPGWKIEDWDYEMVAGGDSGNETVISFTMEAEFEGPGAIYDHRAVLTSAATRFMHYRDEPWHRALKLALLELHERLKKSGPDKVIERIWFRDWTFYCGNGGDS